MGRWFRWPVLCSVYDINFCIKPNTRYNLNRQIASRYCLRHRRRLCESIISRLYRFLLLHRNRLQKMALRYQFLQ